MDRTLLLEQWTRIVKSKLGESGFNLTPQDEVLLEAIANNIVERWRELAEKEMPECSLMRLKELYASNKVRAQGLLYAIMESILKVGSNESIEWPV